jgi:hypothetical protein
LKDTDAGGLSFKERDDNTKFHPGSDAVPCANISGRTLQLKGSPKSNTTELDEFPTPCLHHPRCKKDISVSSPLAAPVTTVDMNIKSEVPKIEVEELLVWTSIEVSADAQVNKSIASEKMVPLDVVIILDNT